MLDMIYARFSFIVITQFSSSSSYVAFTHTLSLYSYNTIRYYFNLLFIISSYRNHHARHLS